MPIKIQNTQTDRVFKIDDETEFHYHVLEPIIQKRLLFANMVNGKIDQDKIFDMSYDFMELMLTDWKGIIDDANDKPIKFKKDLVRIIPLEVAVDFVVEAVIPSFESLVGSAKKIAPKLKISAEEN